MKKRQSLVKLYEAATGLNIGGTPSVPRINPKTSTQGDLLKAAGMIDPQTATQEDLYKAAGLTPPPAVPPVVQPSLPPVVDPPPVPPPPPEPSPEPSAGLPPPAQPPTVTINVTPQPNTWNPASKYTRPPRTVVRPAPTAQVPKEPFMLASALLNPRQPGVATALKSTLEGRAAQLGVPPQTFANILKGFLDSYSKNWGTEAGNITRDFYTRALYSLLRLSKGGNIRGPALIQVGERSPTDKTYATDEYLFVNPGLGGFAVVAPRKKNEKPTAENALRAVVRQMIKGPVRRAATGAKITDPEIPVGGDWLANLIGLLSGQADLFATGIPSVQQNLFNLLGYVVPDAYGVTDPVEFRNKLASGAQIPTAAMKQFLKQLEESQRQFDLAHGEGSRQFDLSHALNQEKFGLEKTLGLGQLELAKLDQALRQKQAENELMIALRELGLQEKGLGLQAQGLEIQKMLGLGELDIKKEANAIQKLLGLEDIGVRKESNAIQKLLGLEDIGVKKGQLELGREDLELKRLLGMGELDIKRAAQALAERNQAMQEAELRTRRELRGLRAVPGIGQIPSYAPV